MAKRMTLSPWAKPVWKTSAMTFSPEALVLDVHHGIVALRIEGLARFAEGLDAQRVEDLDKLCQGHLHALL